MRLIRDGAVVHDGEIGSLRRFNDDVREVLAGFECGVVLANYANVEQGDTMEVYETRQVERTLAALADRDMSCSCGSTCSSRVRLAEGQAAELNRVKALLRERLHTSVAEVGHQDSWQRSTLAVAIAARSVALAQDTVDTVQRALDGRFPQGVRIEHRLASWEDLESLG